MKITEVLPHGFAGYDIQKKDYSVIKIVDKKIPNIFLKDEILSVSIQYADEPKEDIVSTNLITLYAVVGEFMPRGFYTWEYQKEKNPIKRFLFKNERGYIVLPELEKRDIFDIGDLISLSISITNQKV